MTDIEIAHLLDTIISANAKLRSIDGEYSLREKIEQHLLIARNLTIKLAKEKAGLK